MLATRSRLLPIALGLLGAAFLLVAAVSTRTAPDSYPTADTATTSIAALQAARGALSVGAYSRFGWNHPGPLLYQILAVPYELSGRREIALKWTALALNLAWLGGLLVLVARRAPTLAVTLAVALIPLLWREQRLLFFAWNPFVTVLALAFAVAAAADLATGRGWRTRLGLTWLAGSLSFCIQAHVGLVVPAAVCVVAATIGLWRRAGPMSGPTWRTTRAGIVIAAAVVTAVWLTPVIAELRATPGNLVSMIAFLSDGSLPRRTWALALPGAAYMTLGPYLPMWVLHFNEVPASLPASLPALFVLLIAATASCTVRLHRRARHYEAAVGAIAAVASVGVVISAKGIVGPLSDYLLVWATAIGALDIAVVLATLLPPLDDDARATAFVRTGGLALVCVTAWAVIGGVRIHGKHAEQARDTTMRALATDLRTYCDRAGVSRPLLAFADDAWREAAGLVLQFDKADRPIAVEAGAVHLVGSSFAATGREDATFYLMPTEGATLPPDAGQTAWITTRGGYRVVRLGVR